MDEIKPERSQQEQAVNSQSTAGNQTLGPSASVNQETPTQNLNQNHNKFDFRYLIVLVSSIIAYLLLIPLNILLAYLPFFSKYNVFPGFSLILTLPLTILFVGLLLLFFLKFLLKQKKYAFTGIGVFLLLFTVVGVYTSIQQRLLANKFISEIDTKEVTAKETKIEITDFKYEPIYDQNGVVTKMKFKIKFNSNKSADMTIYPQVNLFANHINGGQPFRFYLDVDESKYGDLVRDKHGNNTVFVGENIVEFSVSNLGGNSQYITGKEGKFEVLIRFGINQSDPYNQGQGNATSIKNIKDVSGKAIIDQSENQLGEVYLTPLFKISNEEK